MFTPLILTALLPLNPALFMRGLVSWFIGIFLAVLHDPETRAMIRANPKDRSLRLELLGSLVLIEDMIAALIFIRARLALGQRPYGRRKGRRFIYRFTGHAPSLEEIERRFQRALKRLDAVERHAASFAVKLARLAANAASHLECVHHPVEATTTTTTSACISTTTTIPFATISTSTSTSTSTHIRAPPRLGPFQKIKPQPNPQASPARPRPRA